MFKGFEYRSGVSKIGTTMEYLISYKGLTLVRSHSLFVFFHYDLCDLDFLFILTI